MVTDVLLPTGLVDTVKVAVVAFAATVTLAGTVATKLLLLLSATTAPDDEAGPFSVSVPVDELLPITDGGLIVRALTPGGVMVIPVIRVLLL